MSTGTSNRDTANIDNEEQRKDEELQRDDAIEILGNPETSQSQRETSQRHRKPTEKGKEYETSIAIKNYNKCVRLVKRSVKNLDLETIAGNELESIKRALKDANLAFDNFEDALLTLKECLNYEGCSDYEQELDNLETLLKEHVGRAKEAMQSLIDRRNEVTSLCLSKLSKQVGSKKSFVASSTSSSRDGKSLENERWLKIEKAAALRAQLSYHEAQTKIREKRVTLEQEEQRLDLECQIAGLEASAEVLKVGAGSVRDEAAIEPDLHIFPETAQEKRQRILNSIDDEPSKLQPVDAISISSNRRVRTPSLTNINDDQRNRIVSGLPVSSRVEEPSTRRDIDISTPSVKVSYELPKVKIEPFDGKATEFPAWEVAFDAHVGCQDISVELKLNLLSQHLRGEAKSLVIGLLSYQTDYAYSTARSRLKDRYGNPCVLSQAFLSKLEEWLPIKPNQPKELEQFSDLLIQISEIRKIAAGSLSILDYPQESKKILAKLPFYFERDWREYVYAWKEKHGPNSYPSFDQLAKFIERRANRANLPELQPVAKRSVPVKMVQQEKKREVKNAQVFSTEVDSQVVKCSFCSKEHDVNTCEEFLAMGRDAALGFLKQHRLCFGCASTSEHVSRHCPCRCVCAKCDKRHLTVLHIEKPIQEADSKCTEVCSQIDQQNGIDNSMIVPVWVRSKYNTDSEVLCYCIIDDQSNTCFMSETLFEELNVLGQETNITLSTMHQSKSVITCQKVTDLEIVSFDRKSFVNLPQVFTREVIPASRSQIPKPDVARQWDHLKEVADQLPPYQPALEISLLIGNNVPCVTRPREVVAGNENEPYAQRSLLGWGIIGTICHSAAKHEYVSHRLSCFPISDYPTKTTQDEVDSIDLETLHGHAKLVYSTKAKEVFSPAQVKRMFELDFIENSGKTCELSANDRKFVDTLSQHIHKREDGHYVMPLPLKPGFLALPNNRQLCEKRLHQLKRRFQKNPKFMHDYVEYMKEVLENWAERVPHQNLLNPLNKPVNYVPHTGVYHPKKPEKIRVVFDCSAEYGGVSLNDYLLTGPNLMNGMVGVMLRFRKEEVALMADIQSMFCQFFMEESCRDLLRFLWWEDGDMSKPIVEYRMIVHLFGAASSPGCANFGLKRAADDGEAEFGADAADFVRLDFYMDDGLTSVGTVEEAVSLIERSRALCSKAGLRLHKFVANKMEVLDSIPESERAKSLKSVDLHVDPLPLERALGVIWCLERDVFSFRIELKDCPLTRRGILSTICSIFDPIGYVAPVLLEGKRILQQLTRENVSWDDPVPENLASKWRKWRSSLVDLQEFEVKRCLKPPEFGTIAKVELHHFSDASEVGYGECSYVRMRNSQGDVHCSFLMGKARVTPLKQISIPRLELTAAVLSVKTGEFLKDELKYENVTQHYWVDSKVVLGYIKNEAKRFHTYVANRVQQIHDLSDPESWLYVESRHNSSDAASRGLSVQNLVQSEWLSGPSFLWKKCEVWNNPADIVDDEAETLIRNEMRKATVFSQHVSTRDNTPLQSLEVDRLNHISCWYKAKRCIANCLKLKTRLMKKIKGVHSSKEDNKITTSDLVLAENEILRSYQMETFNGQYAVLLNCVAGDESRQNFNRKKASLKKLGSLYRLDPFVDEDRLMRVGGRLQRSDLMFGERHPVVIPRRGHITELIVRFYHEEVCHLGRSATLNHLRQNGFWVIGGSAAVSSYIRNCVICKRRRGTFSTQKMADLPVERLAQEPPFTYCGVDLFGPFLIKEKRSMVKRYGVIFTCFSSRAIHLEIANTLDTSSFLNAVRRFLGRRGPIKQLHSDCGSNIVGAKNALLAAFKEMDHREIEEYLHRRNCDWFGFKFNTPCSSHMGGVWERQIRSVRSVLTPLLVQNGNQLGDETFHTLMVEVENIVNSRPLSVIGINDPDFPEPLTPSHLLTLKPKLLLPPPGKFQQPDLYVRQRWRRVQHLANQFWLRWRKEFVQSLQGRGKWISPQRNFRKGDVVLVFTDNLQRNQWPLALVEDAIPSSDGLVRKVRLRMANKILDGKGKPKSTTTFLDRPINKLILLSNDEVQSQMRTKRNGNN